MMVSDRERAIKAIRRGAPLGEAVKCSCYTNPPTRNGCFGVCEDSVAAIIASYEDLRREAALTAALSDQVVVPKEPTPDMRIAGGIAWAKAMPTAETYVDCADACYKAMIAASPTLSGDERNG